MKSKVIFIFILFITININAKISFTNSIVSSFSYHLDNEKSHLILDYKPKFKFNPILKNLDSFDFLSIIDFSASTEYKDNCHYEFYRLWIRHSTPQSETRFGLQKINFGQAKILRTLQWFDTINPFDPRGESKGVTALLNRNYFENSNLWLWWIIDINNNDGVEETNYKQPGFRYQFLIKNSELAFSFHHKNQNNGLNQNKFGFDIFCDYYLGMWSEISSEITEESSKTEITLGADYTFPIFTGLHLLVENITIHNDDNISNNSAMMVDLPLGLFDNFSSIVLWDYQNKSSIFSFAWQRIYDKFSFNVNTKIIDSNTEIGLILAYDF